MSTSAGKMEPSTPPTGRFLFFGFHVGKQKLHKFLDEYRQRIARSCRNYYRMRTDPLLRLPCSNRDCNSLTWVCMGSISTILSAFHFPSLMRTSPE
ncbi:hypothetical protein PILCRDRAFT_458689 [Piloderma croceum F 1598]|uniref:Uncharacterized protein n=1 Tax=Piloderma croceum (strain F 1598) TaxID=765440 RepID=A0A0C3FEI3_PILCF|nr:hypothetical protein PILCRDRAFT_458689 [Piloderma croceum F 1598]